MCEKVWLFYMIEKNERTEYVSRVYAQDSLEDIFKKHPGPVGSRWVPASIEQPPESYNCIQGEAPFNQLIMRLELEDVHGSDRSP